MLSGGLLHEQAEGQSDRLIGVGVLERVKVSRIGREPDILAQEIADDLQTALDQFQAIAGELGE